MSRPVFIDARHDLLARLVDYAGLFLPATLSMTDAVAEYRAARSGPNAWMLGTFVVPATLLDDLAAVLVGSMSGEEPPWQVSVILEGEGAGGAAHAAAFGALMAPAVELVGAEIRLPDAVVDGRSASEAARRARTSATSASGVAASVMAYLEVPATTAAPGGVTRAVEAIAILRSQIARPLGAKLRCGGATPDLFPSPQVVAEFLVACRDNGLSFKATAGLHHAIRHHDEDLDVVRHGFLNLLVAVALAESGADVDVIASVVAERESARLMVGASGLAWGDLRADAATVKNIRTARFASYGSCSFDEPIEDLTALGILAGAIA